MVSELRSSASCLFGFLFRGSLRVVLARVVAQTQIKVEANDDPNISQPIPLF